MCIRDRYNGVVIRGECYDRQFMFGKGAGSLPTASSILSDIIKGCLGCRESGRFPSLTDRKGKQFPVQCYGACSEVLNALPLELSDRLCE